jgi:hypothetical protein
MTEIEKAKSYLKGVESGKVPSPVWIKKAVARHNARPKEKRVGNISLTRHEADSAYCKMFSAFQVFKGRCFAASRLILCRGLRLWFIWPTDGGVKGGGRRFRKVYCKVPRGNAKTANLGQHSDHRLFVRRTRGQRGVLAGNEQGAGQDRVGSDKGKCSEGDDGGLS